MFKNCQKGFSLLEAIVAITVIGVIGFVVATVITRSFKASDKTQLLGLVKQNGQNALNILESSIRNSAVACISPTKDLITVVEKSGDLLRFRLDSEAIKRDKPRVSDIVVDFGVQDLCNTAILPVKNDTDIFLTDTNPSTGVIIEDFKVVDISDNKKKTIEISFKVRPIVIGSDFSKQLGQGYESFQTTVYVR